MDYKNEFHSDDDFDSSNGYGDNNGNSGYSSGQTRSSNPNGLSKAELRKTNKPIMEKRRRARINHCLNELKSLILEAMKKDPARHTKLEKADILEMTVKHLQSVQRQQLNMAIQTDPSVIHKFKTGFVECADEVNRYINQLEGVDNGVRQRLTNHLTNCATSLEQIGSMTNFNNGYRGQLGGVGAIATANAGIFGNPLVTAATSQLTTPPAVIFPPLPQDLNNNSNSNPGSMPATPIQMGGMHLIPSRLPSGEFALIMPNTPQNATNATVNNILNGNHASAAAIPFIGTTWPTVPVPTAATVNKPTPEFSTNLQRNSAFSKPLQKISNNNTSSPYTNNNTHTPQQHTTINAFHQSHHQNSTMTTSPPLSPISSVSSHGDDSIMHTSSDFNNTSSGRPVTPPKDVSHVAAVQHSFSGVFPTTPPTSADTSLNSSRISSASSSTHLQQQQVSSTSGGGETARVIGTTRKRSLTSSDGNDSSDSSEEPTSKKFITVDKLSAAAVVVADEERDSMWRPW